MVSLASRKRRRASTIVISDSEGEEDVVNPPSFSSPPSRRTSTTSSSCATAESSPEPRPRTKFIVGLDYGTTFSSVSYIKFDPANPPKTLRGEQIKSITDWPGVDSRARNIPEVPSESWYLNRQYYWGYGARQAIIGIEDNNLNYKNRIIQYAKLLLSGNQGDARGPREELRRTLVRARKDETEVSKDYLREILKHSKAFLEEREAFNEDCEVELVFCVPAGWPAKAIRTMQAILLDIAQEIRLGILAPLFVLNEPEAAAAYILEACSGSENLATGEVFMICDAGGGTVDTITYKVRQQRPFRVEEVVAPTGSSCGSGYVNQALKREAIKRIKSTPYESLKGPSFEYIIEHDLMTNFEYTLKRDFRPSMGLDGNEVIVVHGLVKNTELGFGDSTMSISSLDGISKLIRQQINAAAAKGRIKILLVGGFSVAPILRAHIEREFSSLRIMYPPIGLDSTVTVSHGAVFRALNKSDGPKRVAQSNFGFLQLELYNERLSAHREVGRTFNHTDGKYYECVLRKHQRFLTRNWQAFKLDEELVINQQIWVSDFDNARNHHQSSHRCNRGAEIFGILRIDLEGVKQEGLLKMKSGPGGNTFYEIHYELCMEIDGRNLDVKLFCPPGGTCRGQTQLCITAAFIPGTE
ncbi:hypothetical protein BJX63DRAFT_424297 [Aspergillus granulosus]|uniref:Uncharacterized protein n=1 Tax=Aspergillus granulosus TaxID=176169 RepID=A0ABR4H085_9EURO